MTSSVQHFNDFVKAIPLQNTINYLHDTLGKDGVKIIYEKAENFDQDTPVYSRLMFGAFNRSCSFEFQGEIISLIDNLNYQAISVPPPPPVTQYQSSFLFKNFVNNTDIIKANDGTTVTIYYFNSKWVISTHRGFEVNSYICAGDKTYQDIIDEVLQKYNTFSYDNLDKSKCYTFGFNHSKFHPFMENSESKNEELPKVRAWFIQSVDLIKFNNSDPSYISYTEDIGIPLQEIVSFPNIKKLFNSANNAYSDYVKDGTINYGYLIRVGLKQYLVESTLLKNIRNIFYSNKFNNIANTFDKNKYIVVNAFLDSSKHMTFKTLFPQYNAEFVIMEKKMKRIVNSIVRINNSKNDKISKDVIDIAALELHKQVAKIITVSNWKVKEATDLIYSFIYDPKYTILLYNLMY